MASATEVAIEIFRSVSPPTACDNYQALYTEYLSLLRYVTSLFAKVDFLAGSVDDNSGLDPNSCGNNLLCRKQVLRGGVQEEVGDGSDRGFFDPFDSPSVLHVDGAVANGENRPEELRQNGDAIDCGGSVATQSVAQRVSPEFTGLKKKRKKKGKKPKKRSSENDGVTGHGIADTRVGGTDGVIDDRGLVAIPLQELGGVDDCRGRGTGGSSVRSGVITATRTRGQETTAEQATYCSSGVGSRSLSVDSCDVGSVSSESSVTSDGVVRLEQAVLSAKLSLWKKRDAANRLSISKIEKELSDSEDSSCEAVRRRGTRDFLTGENTVLRREMAAVKKERLQLLQTIVSLKRGINL